MKHQSSGVWLLKRWFLNSDVLYTLGSNKNIIVGIIPLDIYDRSNGAFHRLPSTLPIFSKVQCTGLESTSKSLSDLCCNRIRDRTTTTPP